MKRAVTNDLTGEHRKIRSAGDVTEPERYAYTFNCLNLDCGAEFHLRRRTWARETTEEVAATFVRNPSSQHKAGCDYDYESKASRSEEKAFFRDGKFHLRINFPMGSSYSDLHPQRGRLTAAQKATAQNNTGKKAVGTVAGLVKFLEREFGSLENPALENLILHYQGRNYEWPETFGASSNATKIFETAANRLMDVTAGMLAVVRAHQEISASDKGKRRFICAEAPFTLHDKKSMLRPVIVCETAMLAQGIKAGSTVLVAARPFIPPHILHDENLHGRGAVPVYLYVADRTQFAAIDDKYWNPVPGKQIALFGDLRP